MRPPRASDHRVGEGQRRAYPEPLPVESRAMLLRVGRGEPAQAQAAGRRTDGLEHRPAGRAGRHPPDPEAGRAVLRPIEYHTRPRDIVYEPFSGSGTQLIAAERTGRICYATEQEPRYIEFARARWEAFSGEKAVRA